MTNGVRFTFSVGDHTTNTGGLQMSKTNGIGAIKDLLISLSTEQ